MFSFFKKASKPVPVHLPYSINDGLTIIDTYKMSLDERMVWRLEMMRKSVIEVLSGMGITESMYSCLLYTSDAADE